MTKEEYDNFRLRYKGCGACFPIYSELSRFEKMWFTAIQKDVTELTEQNTSLLTSVENLNKSVQELETRCNELFLQTNEQAEKNKDLEEERNDYRDKYETVKNESEVKIAELEKENAELKKSCQIQVDSAFETIYEKDDQLTKAKVALRKVVDYLGQFCSDYPDCVIEAEKILKEE